MGWCQSEKRKKKREKKKKKSSQRERRRTLQDLFPPSPSLASHGPAVHRIARPGNEPERKLALEHEHRAPERRAVRQQLKHNRRRDVVRHVGHDGVEKRQFDLAGSTTLIRASQPSK
jgi:hypothetical protein